MICPYLILYLIFYNCINNQDAMNRVSTN